MRWALTRGLVIGVAGLLMGAVACVWAYSLDSSVHFSMDRDPARVVTGLFPVEAGPTGPTFAWTREEVQIDLPGLNRRGDWRLRVVARGGRPAPLPLPRLSASVDGVEVVSELTTNEFRAVDVPIAAREDLQAGAHIVLRVSPTFQPGGGDPRALGVQVDDISIEQPSDFGSAPPRTVLIDSALAAAVAGAAFGMVRVTAGSAIAGAGIVAIGQAVVLTSGVAPYAGLAPRALWIMVLLASSLVGTLWSLEWWRGDSLRNTARFAGIFTMAATYLKLLVLWHPGIDVRDALFQAHRFEWVLSGRYFFTSIAPGGYEFPYAIALYVVAAPLRALAVDTAGLMDVLRGVVAIADGAAGLLLYPLLMRAGASRLAGAVAVALYHLLPLNFDVQWVANQTNAFGQSMVLAAAAGTALLAPALAKGRGVGQHVLCGSLLTMGWALAFLSHTSSFAIGAVLAFGLSALTIAQGDGDARAMGRRLFFIASAAALASWLIYYGHFTDIYAAQYARISGEVAGPAAASDPGGRSIVDRVSLVPHYVRTYFGLASMILALVGVGAAWRERDRRFEALTLRAWVATCAAFLALGILTPVDMRYYLAALPVVAWLGAVGADWLWARARAGRAAAAVLLIWASLAGIAQWLEPIRP